MRQTCIVSRKITTNLQGALFVAALFSGTCLASANIGDGEKFLSTLSDLYSSPHLTTYSESGGVHLSYPTEIKQRSNPIGFMAVTATGSSTVAIIEAPLNINAKLFEEISTNIPSESNILISCSGENGDCGFYTPREFIRSPVRQTFFKKKTDIYNLNRQNYNFLAAEITLENERYLLTTLMIKNTHQLVVDLIKFDDTKDRHKTPETSYIAKSNKDTQVKQLSSTPLMQLFFMLDNYSITNSHHQTLENMAEKISKSKNIFLLSGHTDQQGTDSHNRKLAQQRAEAASSYLTNNLGVPKTKLQISTKNFLKSHYDDHAKNRRVDLIETSIIHSPSQEASNAKNPS